MTPTERIERLERLLAEAVTTADRRTRERDDALARLRIHRMDAELGYALRHLDVAVTRLRRARVCPTMGFDPSDPEDNARSMVNEVDELRAEVAGTDAARSEVRDIITIALNLAQGHRLDLVAGLLAQADKLHARVDALEAGLTWAEAKARESDGEGIGRRVTGKRGT